MSELASMNPPQGGPHKEWDLIGSHELEPAQRDRVHAFRDALQECYAHGGVKVLDITQYDHVVTDPTKPINGQLSSHIEKKLNVDQEALMVSPQYSWLSNAGLTKFSVLRSSKAETSAHQVFFGILHQGNPEEGGLNIAIKPCVDNPMTACNDWLNAELAGKMGERRFPPIGFMVHDGIGYSLTEIKFDSDTLDTSRWQNVLLDENNPEFKGQIEVLGDAAMRLAQLHRGKSDEETGKRVRRVAHGDPQFKNIAMDVTGELFFIDWESAEFLGEDPKYTNVLHVLERDLRIMFSSMARSERDHGIGLIDTFHHPVQWILFKKHIFNPYMETYLGDADVDSEDFTLLADMEAHLKQYITRGELYENLRRPRNNNHR